MLAFACAIFTSAFLVFQVQPIIARFILPWFGGSPTVWTTCMLFFQIGLLAGYAYAHLLATRVTLSKQPLFHLSLLIVSMMALPIAPDQTIMTSFEQPPTVQVLILLLSSVGFPFVILSASAPLIQHWFANANPGLSPFRLYALSNVGSLVALLSYPFWVEPTLTLNAQTTTWSVGYVLFTIVMFWCAWPIIKVKSPNERLDKRDAGQATRWTDRVTWTALAACGSVVLMATTNQMSQDIAVVPFLWVLPLSLYLISFIICFERDSWYLRALWIPYFVLSVGALVYLLHQDYANVELPLAYQIGVYTSAMFACCMVCHGELVRRRPAAQQLTIFYLFFAFGGALGGVLVSIIAPLLFDGFWELHLVLIAIAALVGWLIFQDRKSLRPGPTRIAFGSAWVLALATLTVYLYEHASYQRETSIFSTRGFYGVQYVYELNKGDVDHFRALYHGRINHGEQRLSGNNATKAFTYYGRNTGVALAITRHPSHGITAMKVGIIGLGTGTIAAYGKTGDEFKFYEINSQTEEIARSYFTYLSQSRADTEVIVGDGRISLARELATTGPQQFDVLVVDAFSGDAIPIHLLTLEAVDLYAQHMNTGGIMAIHVSNLHIDLLDVVRQLAKHASLEAIHIENSGRGEYYSANDWILLTNNKTFIDDVRIRKLSSPWNKPALPKIWTDDFSNLFETVDW